MYYIKYLDMFRAIQCSSSGGQNCIFTASGIVTLCEWPCSSLSTGALYGRIHPLLHSSYTADCLTAQLCEDVSSWYYVQSEGQLTALEYQIKGQKPSLGTQTRS
jgi:hypothetical protein